MKLKKLNYLWADLFSKRNDNDLTLLSTLKSNLLFSKLKRKEIAYVSKYVHVRHYEPNELIFSQNEKGLGLYIIVKGSVDVKMRPNDKTKEEVSIQTLSSGGFFGELALVDEESRRTASAYAITNTVLIGFFKPDLIEILERKPETGVKILYQLSIVLGKRLSETTEAYTELQHNVNELVHFNELKRIA